MDVYVINQNVQMLHWYIFVTVFRGDLVPPYITK